MSYDLSFEKRQLWLLGVMGILFAVLLAAGGYFAGRLAAPPVAGVLPTVKMPVLPGDKKSDADSLAAGASAGSETKGDSALAASAVAPVLGNAVVPALKDREAPGASSLSAGTASSSGASSEATVATGTYTLQFGVFHDSENAKALAKDLADKGTKATVSVMHNSLGEALSAVRYGSYATSDDAMLAAREQAKLLDVEVVVRPSDRL